MSGYRPPKFSSEVVRPNYEPSSKLLVLTIVLDGMPWISCHYPELRKLKIPWEWWVVEGVAAPVNCTSWVRAIPPRLSEDGTTEYLDSLTRSDARVKHIKSMIWPGKCAMLNHALSRMYSEGILLEVDSDELWTAEQMTRIVGAFEQMPEKDYARFWCRFYVGPDLIITTRNTYGNHPQYEWIRAWRYQFGNRFNKHEPPEIEQRKRKYIQHHDTEKLGLVFEHRSYATEATMRFKQTYYPERYANAVDNWKRLQDVQEFPVKLKDYFPWVDDEAMVERIKMKP